MILRERINVMKNNLYHKNPLKIIMDQTEDCMKFLYNKLDEEIIDDEKYDQHICYLPYTEYETLFMFFKYYLAKTELNPKQLILTSTEYPKFNVNTVPLHVLLSESNKSGYDINAICKDVEIDYSNIKINNNLEQLCLEHLIINLLQTEIG
jgi:hypothetical protein